MAPRAGDAAFVGRADETARLTSALDRAERGQGGVVVLAGEAGVGKTRIAREVLDAARQRGFLCLEGRAHAFGGELAFGPVVEAFGAYLRGLDRHGQAVLLRGLTDLGRLFADLHLPASEPLGDAALERLRLFEAFAHLVERLAAEHPTVVFLDDLHWADRSTLELMAYLARTLTAQPVLLLGCRRPEEPARLRLLLRALRRSGVVSELDVGPLDAGALAALSDGLLGGTAPEALHRMVAARSGGIPLYAETLVRALRDTGDLREEQGVWVFEPGPGPDPPALVRDIVLERLERLGDPDRRLVELLAVAGQPVGYPVLAAVTGQDDETLVAQVRDLGAAGVLAEDGSGARAAVGLAHPLLGEVVYGELTEGERRLAHLAFVAALERVQPDDVDQLSRHYRAGGDAGRPDRAVDVLVAAGHRARALPAHEEAARHYAAALELVRRGHRHDVLRALLESLAEAWAGAGESEAALEVWSEALALAESSGDAGSAARVRRQLALIEYDRGEFALAHAHLDRAIAEAPSIAELTALHQAQATIHARGGDRAAATASVSRLRALAERTGAAEVFVDAHLAEIALAAGSADYPAARAALRRALTAAGADAEPLVMLRVHDAGMVLGGMVGDIGLLHEHGRRGLRLARELGVPPSTMRALGCLVLADLLAGRWREAEVGLVGALALARRLDLARGIVQMLGMRVFLLLLRGDLAWAARVLADAEAALAPITDDRNATTFVEAMRAMLALESGDPARALAGAGARARGGGPLMLRLGLLAEAQAATGRAAEALATAHSLAALDPDNPYVEGLAARAAGLAHRAGGETAEAEAALATAERWFTRGGAAFEAARAMLERATVSASPEAAREAASQSLAALESLGAMRHADQARKLLRDLGVRVTPRRRPGVGESALSQRELEVARLVAEGLTTAQVAARLVVAPSTVSTHLHRIYERLGVGSRTALTRYLAEHGLLTTP